MRLVAGIHIVSLPGPSWADEVLVAVTLIGGFVGATLAWAAIGWRGRPRVAGLLIALAIGLAAPAAAWVGLRGRTAVEVGGWTVVCERPLITDVSSAVGPGTDVALMDAAVTACRARGVGRVRVAAGLIATSLLLVILAVVVYRTGRRNPVVSGLAPPTREMIGEP